MSSGIAANNKAYDGTATATLTSNNVVLAGVLAGDAGNVVLLTNGYVANFNNGSAGNGKPVTVSGLSLGGSASGNYSLTQPTGLSANITALGVTVSSGLSANNKAYDGTANATLTSNNVVLAGVLAGDAGNVVLLTNGYVANFNNGSAGNGKPVTVSGLSLGGSASGNYSLTQPAGLSANITALGVTVSSGITANNKAYDGTTVATITSNNVVLAGVLAGDAGNVVLCDNEWVRGELQQWERGEWEAGDSERSEPGRECVRELQFDATGGIEREHHGPGGDGEQRVEREQQGV